MNTRILTLLATLALTTIVASGSASACGGKYQATLEADTGAGVGYCSDGTLDEAGMGAVPATGSGTPEGCGGNYPAAVEVSSVMVAEGMGVGYCSDGTLDAAAV